jgi:large subunit ribosomal protein L3
MILGTWGRKIGMTQRFLGDAAVPVTAIQVADWVITNVRRKDRDGYAAIQVGQMKKKYRDMEFSSDWIKESKKYFSAIREVRVSGEVDSFVVGAPLVLGNDVKLDIGEKVDVTGITKGLGFQGVVKRHGAKGGGASHGDKLGRAPGSGSSVRRSGNVFKGRKFPGQTGNETQTTLNLEVVSSEGDVLFVKGAVPGRSRSLVFVRKHRKSR